ncbi:flagellar biosynthetic protein FliO [Rubripirellula amarantea]|nr:flagellar biosynthetic protein FliO [Rubripirellula amarantea]
MLSPRCFTLFIFASCVAVTSNGQDQPEVNPSVYGRRAVVSISESQTNSNTLVQASYETDPSTRASNFPTLNSMAVDDTDESGDSSAVPDADFAAPMVTVTSSLAVVLGLFAAMVWITRKYGAKSMGSQIIPKDVLYSLGSTSIDPRTRVSMLRVGGKILVIAHTASGIEPLSEITDADEVRRLTAACSGKSKQEFASTIASIEREGAENGFVDGIRPTPATPRRPGSLFATA